MRKYKFLGLCKNCRKKRNVVHIQKFKRCVSIILTKRKRKEKKTKLCDF